MFRKMKGKLLENISEIDNFFTLYTVIMQNPGDAY